jgi:hypothetical protein
MKDFMAIFDGLASQAFLPGSSIGPVQARDHLTGWVRRVLAAPEPSTAKRQHPPTRRPK